MTYQVLARKWRPQDFASLVGQEPIITALRNGLKDNRIAQAYLFSGIRGVGKTTAARVLSKALNCERGPESEQPAPDPCNECTPCTEITAGKDLDVLEVDAATYSKVEQVRELTESLRYGPARDRYKVVVLDEVHRLSRQAFDALLKIVEEPPPHLVFIFATTEVDAVPTTILSRCQEFQFRRVSSQVLATYLRKISNKEDIQASDTALRMIARAGEGSVRDSVALLDQLATFGNSRISDSDAANLLGGLDAAIFHRLLTAMFEGNSLDITESVQEIEANGWDPHNVFSQFLHYVRDALHLAVGTPPESVDLPLEESRSLADLVRPHGYENILRLLQHLLASEPTVRRSEFALLALQLAWLRAAELPKLTRIERILSGGEALTLPTGSTSDPPTEQPTGTPKTEPSPPLEIVRADQPDILALSRSPSASKSPDPDATQPNHTATASQGTKTKTVSAFCSLLGTRRQPLAALFRYAELVYEANQLSIYPQEGDSLLASALQRENNKALLEELLFEVWGPGTNWTLLAPKKRASPSTEPASKDSQLEAQKDSTVQAVLEVFGGNIQSVQ